MVRRILRERGGKEKGEAGEGYDKTADLFAMKTHDTLIPTRFMSTICFLVATIMVFSTMPENILAALPPKYSESSYQSCRVSFTFALSLNLICIGVNLLGFMLGFSMFMPAICVINIVSHTLGCIYTCVFIMQSWYLICVHSYYCVHYEFSFMPYLHLDQ